MRIVDLSSSFPIAAINGEPPELIGLEIGATTLRSGDTRQVLRRLTSLTADRQTALSCEGKLSLMIGGYDTDARAVPQIGEFKTYMTAIMSAWPYLGWFCMLNDDLPAELEQLVETPAAPDFAFLNIVLAGACECQPQRTATRGTQKPIQALSFNRDVVISNATSLLNGVLRLGELHQVDNALLTKRIAKIEAMFERTGVLA